MSRVDLNQGLEFKPGIGGGQTGKLAAIISVVLIGGLKASPAAACGACLDAAVVQHTPFVFYWILVMFIWSLVAGPVLFSIARRRHGPVEVNHPVRLLGGMLLMLALGGLLMMGAVAAPQLLTMLFWFKNIFAGIRQNQNLFWRKANLWLVMILLILIPLSYLVLPWPHKDYSKRQSQLRNQRYEQRHESSDQQAEMDFLKMLNENEERGTGETGETP